MHRRKNTGLFFELNILARKTGFAGRSENGLRPHFARKTASVPILMVPILMLAEFGEVP